MKPSRVAQVFRPAIVFAACLTIALSAQQPVGGALPPWTRGTLDIHQISTGRRNSALIVFPDGTTCRRSERVDLFLSPYVPDFIIRLETDPVVHLILETKGFDDLADVKAGAAQRWVAAVNADGQFGRWQYEMARAIPKVRVLLDQFL
jgi:hypothetical protein